MTRSPTGQVHNCPCDILRSAQSPVGVLLCYFSLAPLQVHQSGSHLRGEEPRGDAITQYMPGPKLDRKVPSEMDRCCFGGGVSECGVLAK